MKMSDGIIGGCPNMIAAIPELEFGIAWVYGCNGVKLSLQRNLRTSMNSNVFLRSKNFSFHNDRQRTENIDHLPL